MTTQEYYRGFLIKLSLLVSLCTLLALLAAQNASLKSQVASLQIRLDMKNQIDIHNGESQNPFPVQRKLQFNPISTSNLRSNGRNVLTRGDNWDEKVSSTIKNIKYGRNLSSKKGSKKSSKRHCSSSRTMDSATMTTSTTQSGDGPTTARCEDLRQVVFDLSTEIKSLEGQTLRYNALADELQQTAIVGGGNPSRQRRELQNFQYNGELNDSLSTLKRQEDLIRSGNERVTGLNVILRENAMKLLGLNEDLTEEKLALLQNITFLSQENFDLLNAQTRLADQINSLNATLDTYKNLLENQGDLNGELNQTTSILEAEIDRLVAANEEYKRLNVDLNNTIGDITNQNTELANQNNILKGLNKDLNNTIDRLNGEIGNLSSEIDRLTTQNGQLSSEVTRLQNATADLEEVRLNLESNVTALEGEVDNFSNKVDELQQYNDELENIVSFVNETGSFLNETMGSITGYLSEQIVAYRSVATETLQNTFIQRAALWDCAYRDHFGDDAFSSDDKLPIPDNRFDDVMSYVDNRVLQELCLSLDDFEKFLESEFDDPVYTTNHIVAGIASYTYLAFGYYFPDADDSGGITEADWALAGYNCQRLAASKQFIYTPIA